MSSSLEQPGGNNEPTWGEGGTGEGSMKQHFHKEQLEGASDHASEKGAPNSLELGHEGKMSQSGAAGGQQSAATSNLSEAQTAEPEMTESVKRACTERAPSPVPSVISMRSEGSMNQPLHFKGEDKGTGVFLAAGGVQCDVCSNPAAKACLTCRDSYCNTCIRPHYCDPDLEKHQLQDVPQLKGRCVQHNKKLKFYCRTDQSAICSHCFLSHNGHDIITVKDQTALQTQTQKEGVPPPGPIQFLTVQPNSVTLRWSPPEGAPGAYRYKVTWRRGQDSRSIEVVGPEVEVGGLLPGEKYHFSVITLGEDGHRSTCMESSVQTEVPVPKDLTVTPGSTCVSVAWAKPHGLQDKVSYLCELFKEELVKSIVTDDLDFNVSGLQHDAEYTVHLSTILPNNRQSKQTSKDFRTETRAPQHLTVRSSTSSSAHLSWEVPPEMKQIPHRFLVSYHSKEAEPKSIFVKSCSTVITGLRPGAEYSVTVCTELQQEGRSKPASVQMKTGFRLADLLQVLSLNINEKITFSSVLEIRRDMLSDRPVQSLKQLPWAFLRKQTMCNLNARNLSCIDGPDSVHPLDLITAVLLCSDPLLQQEIFSKMSMCQFAVPLLLPNCDTQQSTLMLWAMRDIVKIYRPHSVARDRKFVEGRIVDMDIPMVSFVRLGDSSLPKSQILNKLLSNPHQHYDTFIHRDMECGDVPRRISDGLVEVSWYLPCGNPNIDKFTKPVAMANLRGDGRLFETQMSFLCQTSAAVFIFSDDPEDVLSNLANSDSKAELYLVPSSQNLNMDLLRNTCRKHNFKEQNVIVKAKQSKAEFIKILCSCLSNTIVETLSKLKVSEMAAIAHDVGFITDEDCKECKSANDNATIITEKLTDIEEFKLDHLPLHGEMWKKISESEKEICRMRKAGKDIEHYRSKLRNQKNQLRGKQSEKKISDAVFNFIAGITQESQREHLYFLKWLKIQLDTLSRHHLSKLREQYKECRTKQGNMNCSEMVKLDEEISRGSLGPEHFFRELGQLYECAYSSPDDLTRRTVEHLPSLCAQMLLDGFPIELVDGDASNIPLKWISEVLTQLHEKVGSSKILVLTVLGVQGTGKSTLLNTMFGVQFAVSSGRCTRGAFMVLIKVSEDLRPELKCDFLIVIDTEGLKSPELAAMDTSYEHDNELATLVIGLSDITIVNVAMENSTEMKDILQIVVHAFLRMKEVGKKPRCVFVHQNVSDLSAHDINMRDRNKLVDQLNEMTRAAAKMERRESNTKFTDVMEYDPDNDSYYIPGLWHGTPPMAPVNTGYSEAVDQLKKSLINVLKHNTTKRQNALEFFNWTQSLWDAVKFENFIFNFKNSLVAEAYTLLCSEYNKLEWSFQKSIISWLQDRETYISNFGFPDCKNDISVLRAELGQMTSNASTMLNGVEEEMMKNLDKYFSKKDNNVILVEQYKEDFKNSVRSLRRETEGLIRNSLHRAIGIREGMEQVNKIKNSLTETIKNAVLDLLQNCEKNKAELSDKCLDQKFEDMWKVIMAQLPVQIVEKKDLHKEVLCLLRSDFSSKASHFKTKLDKRGLDHYGMKKFTVKAKWFSTFGSPFHWNQLKKQKQEICNSIITECEGLVLETVQNKKAFYETYIKEILQNIDEKTRKHALGEHCEVALKLHVCGRAFKEFQKMHDDFITTNSPQGYLEESKSKFKEEFKDVFHKRDQCHKKAKEFIEEFLKPAVQDYVNRKLGPDIADEMMRGDTAVGYSTATNFQFSILKQMLLEEKYMNYKGYIGSYAYFVKKWIKMEINQMLSKNDKIALLQKIHVSDIVKKIIDVLQTKPADKNTSMKEFVQNIFTRLKDQLIFSNSVKRFLILNTAKTEQFSISLREFVKEMEESMAESYKSQNDHFYIELLPIKPHDILFNRVIGCGQQCPFCRTPCEAGGKKHKKHFCSMHRPQGLGRCCWTADVGSRLATNICSSLVTTRITFQSPVTKWKFVPMKQYRKFYPHWKIKGEAETDATDYWKYVFMKFNKEFAEYYQAEPADIPQGWTQLTRQDAMKSLTHSFKIAQ